MTETLRLNGVSKSFGSFQALKGIDLLVNKGERRAIIGPNGAGKSTLFNIIAGQLRPSHGDVYLNGKKTTNFRPDQMWSYGLCRTFQRNQLFPGLSVWDNVRIACESRRQGHIFEGSKAARHRDSEVADILSCVHLETPPAAKAGTLAYGEQRQLELALALAGKPALLLLDEPTAGMSPAETESMLGLLSGLPSEITLLIVEHDMDVVFKLANRITVLHLGMVLAEGTPREIQDHDEVRDVYMGSQGRK